MDRDAGRAIESLELPAGWLLQWRSDGRWRKITARHHR